MAHYPRPVKRIDVEGKFSKARIVLLVLSVTVALVAFGIGISAFFGRNTGWQEIEAMPEGVSCAGDFTLSYYFGDSGASAAAENKAISALYSDAVEEGYRLFYPDGELARINAAPNTAVTVDPAVYAALQKAEKAGNRCLYLAPVYVEYDRVFQAENEVVAAGYDPSQSAEVAAYVEQIAEYANDPAMASLEFLDGNRVMLKLAPDYLSFAQENEITEFLDFGWMKNAFIIDYMADILVENGYTRGFLASFDGFTRNLDASGQNYNFNLFDRLDDKITRPAVMTYTGPMSIVYLRNYPLSDRDKWQYYSFANGHVTTAFIDPADGMSKSATDNLVVYSASAGCADVLLAAAPVFLADELQTDALQRMQSMGIGSVWFEGNRLLTTDANLILHPTEDAEGYQLPNS